MNETWEYAIVEWLWDVGDLKAYFPADPTIKERGSYAAAAALLTRLGGEGWEVIGNTANANWVFWTLKRRSG